MNGNIFRLKDFFVERIKPGINACIKYPDNISSTILMCCAIDFLSKYYNGSQDNKLNKAKYIEFLKRYFPNYLPHEEFYKFVRCGLVHGYDMEGKYILINSRAKWALDLHMKYDPKHKAYILNPVVLYRELLLAFETYIEDLKKEPLLRKNLDKTSSKHPFRRQYLKASKFKNLVKDGFVKL